MSDLSEIYYYYEIRRNGRYGELVADSDGFDDAETATNVGNKKLAELNDKTLVLVIKHEKY